MDPGQDPGESDGILPLAAAVARDGRPEEDEQSHDHDNQSRRGQPSSDR